ncbi:hypothetical protein [Sphaerisporangium fuscum]|uniref:hypothetical protein n=1 Tax=Sphaerisporangium fuscum TaxID=2835868 RepID=UPI001BDCAD10|nr:hypothetical protein [Sphaerisporangium fuscum]
MAPPRARTLLEAHLYVTLTAGGPDAAETEHDFEAHTTLTEGAEEWTLRFDGHPLGLPVLVEVQVPYDSEAEARAERLPFGSGRSELIDAGQWRALGASYARRAMREDLMFAAAPGDRERFEEVLLTWELARDATIEAARFLPEGADEVPGSGFWTEQGAEVRREAPGRFTRESLEDDIYTYQEMLDDFVAAHFPGTT